MLELQYKCKCMTGERTLAVRFREPAEDIVDWMQKVVQPEVGRDHTAKSPWCRSNKMEWVKIPVPENAAGIGSEPKLDS